MWRIKTNSGKFLLKCGLAILLLIVATATFTFFKTSKTDAASNPAPDTSVQNVNCEKAPYSFSNTQGICLAVVLSGTSKPLSFTLSGKIGSESINFKPIDSKVPGGSTTGYFAGMIVFSKKIIQGCNTSTGYSESNTDYITLTATDQSGSTTDYDDLCNDPSSNFLYGSLYIHTMDVSSTTPTASLGSIYGSLEYGNDTYVTQTACAYPTVSNIKTGKYYPLTITNNSTKNGYITTGNVLPPGKYKLNIDCGGSEGSVQIGGTCNVGAGDHVNTDSSSCKITNSSPPKPKGGPTPTSTCESTGGVLSWIVCAGLDLITNMEDRIVADIVQPLLETRPINFSANSKCANKNTNGSCSTNDIVSASIYSVWNDVRIYGDVVLVIAVLITVYFETMAGGASEAYALNRILPRIVVAAILINLSIYLMAGLEDVVNILGAGIHNLLEAPFLNTGLLGIKVNGWTGDFTTLGAAALVAGAAFTPGIGGLALIIFAGLLLAAFGVIITMMIRQGLIILLLLVSPVAFALYCLPNTEKYFKQWLTLFIRTLLVYPIVMIVIAGSAIAGAVVSNFGITPVFVSQLMGILAMAAPLFLIPFAFRMSGSVMGQVASGIDSIRQRANQPVRKWGRNFQHERWERARAGGYQGQRMGRVYNRIGQGAKAGWRGRYGLGRVGQSTIATDMMANNEQALRQNARLYELRNNDDANAVMGLSGGTMAGARAAARELFTDEHGNYDQHRAEMALAAAGGVGYSKMNASAALHTMAQNKSRAIRAGDYAVVQNGINRLAGGNLPAAERLQQDFQYFSRESGRGDLGGSWQSETNQAYAEDLYRNITAAGGHITMEDAMQYQTILDGIGRTEVPAMVRGYPAQMQGYADTLRTMMQFGNDEQKGRAARHLLEMHKSISYASDDNSRIISNLLEGDASHPGFADLADATPIEDQLAAAAGIGISGLELSRRARVYDRETAMGSTGPVSVIGPTPPPAPPPGP